MHVEIKERLERSLYDEVLSNWFRFNGKTQGQKFTGARERRYYWV